MAESATTYTPGPWHFGSLEDHLLISDSDGRVIADLGPGQADPPAEEQLANARLIRTAPDLLEAARDAEFELVLIADYLDSREGDDTTKGLRKVLGPVRAALAKATGEVVVDG